MSGSFVGTGIAPGKVADRILGEISPISDMEIIASPKGRPIIFEAADSFVLFSFGQLVLLVFSYWEKERLIGLVSLEVSPVFLVILVPN